MKVPLLSLSRVITLAATLVLSGCATVYPPLGWTLGAYAEDEVTPYVLSEDDPNLAACGTGNGLTQLMASFSRVVESPDYVLFYTHLLTGLCAEEHAYEADRRYWRARQQGQPVIARDELLQAQRWHALAAERRMNSVTALTRRYGDLDEPRCPRLRSRNDELAYMVGLVTALQAVRSDLLSGGQVGVPRDLAVQAMRASTCLDNERWWGVPQAIRATVWSFVPGSAPEGADVWQAYRQAGAIAARNGATLPLTLFALGAGNQGHDDKLREALRQAAAILDAEMAPPEPYALVDFISRGQLLYLSDQIWIEQTGARTPAGALGTFPGESRRPAPNIQDLL
ncbi:hypothetical protein [Alloalcanivorax xenomutans]|jgi:hypothetical protein|uniref:hypothetical protein n=1 Tax=Alloalcanivorax xenomutans TaxID=1094342 RepID=UPI001F2950C2|nr:hypothetical protein [Alloalcanivorax xenomutans]MCE7524909.1 hypothetical protein [Alloalcanivorax xenomutans]